ncbi:MAG TPA: hypothetical protein VE553_00830 [Candidatus Binatia bacterium]|nr:hypothetical protein [Candidatus Binatia bacterium]
MCLLPRIGRPPQKAPLTAKVAGRPNFVLQPRRKDTHDYSGGVPRQINNLATACLLQAMAEDASRVNEAILRQTMNEFQLP